MAMNKVPTLIVGIGGIGSQIASEISQLIGEEDRRYVGLVCMDTNVSDLSKLKNYNVQTIQTSDDRLVKSFLLDHPEYTRWFPVNKFLANRGMLQGAGQVRSISRLAAIASEQNGKFQVLKNEINRIRQNHGDGGTSNITVMVVGSITGGTGAGIFLQLPFYIRHLIKETAGINSIVIRGMFIGPDITAGEQPSPLNESAVRVNAYACLKELNAFYLAQAEPDHENLLQLEFYEKHTPEERERKIRDVEDRLSYRSFEEIEASLDDKTRQKQDTNIIAGEDSAIPYDYLYLLEGSSGDGTIGVPSISTVIHLAAHMVFTLMFTPVQDNALSVEDNMVIGAMAHNGMNRYASAGLCKLIFPVDQAREYVTLCSIRDLVSREWLLIDRKYEEEVKQAREVQRTDPTVEIPKLENSYPKHFEDEVKPGSGGTLGHLYQEAFIENPEDHTPISRAVKYADHIDAEINKLLEDSGEIIAAQSACDLELTRMTNVDDARTAISSATTGLEEYEKLARNFVARSRFRIANNMFPSSVDTLKMKKNNVISIYSLLAGVHPVTARFLIYSLIGQLKMIKSQKEPSITLDYDEPDYDPKTEGDQDPGQALENLASKNTLGLRKKLLRLGLRLQSDFEEHKDLITEYIKNSLSVATCDILLNRLRALAEDYELFFQSISGRIKDNADRIYSLENAYNIDQVGQMGIYCSRDAFRNMYQEFRTRGGAEIPESTKTEIFLQLYDVLSIEFENQGKERTQVQKDNDASLRASKLSAVFEHAIVDTIRSNVREHGADIVEMDIRKAFAKQLNIETGISEANTKNFDQELNAYIKTIVAKAMFKAAPLLSVDSSAGVENTESVYMAIHPSCACLVDDKPDSGATRNAYIDLGSASLDGKNPTVLIDEEFKKNEIVCFKTRYMFLIENLSKYKEDSANATAYKERIASLSSSVKENDIAAQNRVVNPHLNRFWHEEAFLPPIDPLVRQQSIRNTKKAFIYAMGLDLFKRDREEGADNKVIWKFYHRNRWLPMFAQGNLIGSGYTDLYRALPFNGRAKSLILQHAQGMMEKIKRQIDPEERFETLKDTVFIEDLIQISPDKKAKSAGTTAPEADYGGLFFPNSSQATHFESYEDVDENILDVLASMRPHMDRDEWCTLFDALGDVLREYLSYMLDENQAQMRNGYDDIIKTMYMNSAAGRKEMAGEPRSITDKAVREQIDILLTNGIKSTP